MAGRFSSGSVHGLFRQIGRGVVHAVPVLPLLQVLEAKIRRQIHDPGAAIEQAFNLMHGGAVRRREKDHVAVFEGSASRVAVLEIHRSAQARKHIVDAPPRFASGSHGNDLCLWVRGENAQQFNTRVAGSSDYGNANHGTFRTAIQLIDWMMVAEWQKPWVAL